MVSLGVPAVADALGLSLGVAVGLLEGVSLGLSEWVLGRDIVLADEAVSDGARVVVSLGVPAVADALGLSLGVAVGLLEGVSLGLSEWVLGRDIVLADEAVSDGARVVVSLGVPAVADALGLSLGVAVGLLEGVSLGLSEWVLGRDIVLADEAVSDGARVVVSLGVPAVADALGLSLGVAVGLLEGVSLGLSEWVLGRDIVLADEAVSDGARVVVSLGVPAVADALGLSLGVAVGLLEGVSLGLSEWVLGRDIVLADEAVSDGARVVVSLGVPAVADALGLSLGVAVGLLEGVSLGLSEWVLGRDIVLADEAVSDGARVVVSLGVPAVADALGLSLGVAVGLLEGVSLGLSEWVLGRDIVLADEAVSDGARVVVSLGVPAVADALGLSLGVAVGLLEGVSLGLSEWVLGRDIVLADEAVSDGARVVVSLGVPAVADALGLSLGVAVGLLEGVSLGLSEWVLGRDIVLADEAVSDGARVVVSLGVPAVADALGLSLGVAVGLLEGVSLGLSEWVLGRDIVLADEAVSDGARVVVSLGVPAVADALGLSLGVAVGLLEGVSLGLSEWVLGRDIVLADEAVSDGARVVVSLGVPAVADALGLSLGVAVGLLEGVSLGLSEWVLGRDIVLADEAVSDGARVVVSLGVPAVADALGLSLGVAVGLLEGVSLGLSEWVLGRDIVLANEAVSDGARVVVSLGVPAVADALGLSLGVAVGLLEGVSLGLSEWVLGRDIVLANEAVSDGARVVVSLGVPAVADALGLSLGVAVGLLEGVSLGLSDGVLGRLADETVSDGARVVVSLGVPAAADTLGLSLGCVLDIFVYCVIEAVPLRDC